MNSLNQYDEKTIGTVTSALTHDEDGNLLSYSGKIFIYNAENRLTSVTPETPSTGSEKLEFVYDYMGRRVKKTMLVYNGSTWDVKTDSLFVYDGWNLIEEIKTESGSTNSKYYVWGLDLSQSFQGAGGVGGLLASVDTTDYTNHKLHYYLYEPNGNVAQMLDGETGDVVASYEYDPFGNLTYKSGSYADENPFRFSTKYHDDESGLVYYGYRYYSPELGRWINRDPIEEDGGVNLYAFVGNDSINYFDVVGLERDCPKGRYSCPKTNHTPGKNGCGPSGWKGALIPNRPLWMIDFEAACNNHDICYDTCNSDKNDCDINFHDEMKVACFFKFGQMVAYGKVDPIQLEKEKICYNLATLYYKAVAAHGAEPYKNAQEQACDCCCTKP